jgi:hypothetical protein
MSTTGLDLYGAWDACQAARRDIREMHADEDAARAHFERAQKESLYADTAEGLGDIAGHTAKAYEEESKGKSASQSWAQHGMDASKHLEEYNAKMGRDPTKGTPEMGWDGPDCTPVGKAMIKEQEDADKRARRLDPQS